MRAQITEAFDRLRSRSKIQLGLDILNIAALIYLGYFVYYVGMKPSDATVGTPRFVCYASALIYSVAHRYLLRDLVRQKKWDIEYGNRKYLTSIATNNLSDLVYFKDDSAALLDRIERSILEAIRSYAENAVSDAQGVTLFVTLIVEDWLDNRFFVCLNRAAGSRPLSRYPKQDLQLAQAAWETTREVYEPDVKKNTSRKNVKYNTVYILPIAFYHPDGPRKAGTIGLLSIDSTRVDHFSGTARARLIVGLLPYLALLRQSLLLRLGRGIWPELSRA